MRKRYMFYILAYLWHFYISSTFCLLPSNQKRKQSRLIYGFTFRIGSPLNTLPAGFELWRNLRSDFAWWNFALVITTTTLAWWLSHMKTPYRLNLKHPIALEKQYFCSTEVVLDPMTCIMESTAEQDLTIRDSVEWPIW